jgi:cellulose synthase/poly-beta-1,6-N-acetylglucosamine synthase-like glycosyltransferase
MTLIGLTIAALDAITAVAAAGVLAIGLGFLTLPALYWNGRAREKQFHASDKSALCEDALPTVLLQLPVYNEGAVVGGLLQAVSALDWPRHKLHIQLLDDSTDGSEETGRAAIDALTREGYRAQHLHRSHRQGYKAGALATGLALGDAPFIAMLDADFRPPPDWLRTLIPRLVAEPHAGFAQSRCEFANADKNWLTRAQGLLFDAHFLMEQDVRARAGLLFQFNGTAGIWRRSAIEDAGGWSAESLCEDLELTVRAALAGWHGIFAMHPPVAGLVPDRMQHWRVQQRRWAGGFAQVARRLVLPVLKSDWTLAQKLSASFLILYQAFLPLVAIACLALGVDIALREGDIRPFLPLAGALSVLAVLVAVSMTLPPYVALGRGRAGRYIAALISLPPLVLYLSFANARATVSAFFGRREAYARTPKPAH